MRRRASDVSKPIPKPKVKPKYVTRYVVITRDYEIIYNSWRPIPLVYNVGGKAHARFVDQGIKVLVYRLVE